MSFSSITILSSNFNKIAFPPLILSAPTSLIVTNLTRNSLRVSWTAPPETFTSYTLKYKRSIDSIWISITNITTTNQTLSSLTANTTYNIIVNAVNSFGSSPDSTQINSTTTNGVITLTTVSNTIISAPDDYNGYVDVNSNFYSVGFNDIANLKKYNGTSWNAFPLSGVSNVWSIVSNGGVTYIGSEYLGIKNIFDTSSNWSNLMTNSTSNFFGRENMIISKTANQRFFAASKSATSFFINTPHTSNALKIFSGGNIPISSVSCCGSDDLSTVYVGSYEGKVHKVTITWGTTNNLTSLICDAGITINTSQLTDINGLACSSDGTIIYASPKGGKIYKSTNSGASFSILNNSPNADATSSFWASMQCSSNGDVIVACRRQNYIYMSSDGGVTWTNNSIYDNWKFVDISRDATKILCAGNSYYTGTII